MVLQAERQKPRAPQGVTNHFGDVQSFGKVGKINRHQYTNHSPITQIRISDIGVALVY